MAGCQAFPSPPTGNTARPSQSVANPELWTRVDPNAIEQPPGFMTVDQNNNEGGPQVQCFPCHPAVDTTMTGVTAGPSGLVAVGWIFQGFHGVAWHSSDGASWALDEPLPEATLLQAVAADAQRYVAVGLNGTGATAWTSTDGVAWQQTSSDAFATIPLRLTAVVHWQGGFAAAGYEGSEFGTAKAAFWVSPDGLAWRQAPEAAVFEDARAWSLAAGGPGLVAVGSAGTSDAPGPAVVWTSPDGLHWTRITAGPVFDGARMRTLTSVPGIGLVAAGEDHAGDTGAVWVSAEGLLWTRAPSSPDLGRPGIQVRMYAVVGGGPGVAIVGTATEGTQYYGEGVVWTSPDGLRWTKQPRDNALVGSELTAIAPWGSRFVAVGDRGAPDTYMATIWTSPEVWSR